ncbi:MAG TPA: NAD(P)-dependent oxidoreductase [Candidatus Binataceae bacterium]|nr:NAD(P)-dependent oxidoreductase [Candidatus Binataceae bacterium]
MNSEIGFIGLGAMGEPMAANLAAAGFKLRVFNRTASKADALVAAGAARAERAGDAVTSGGVAITMLADDAALEQVTLGKDGIAQRLGRGGIHLSMSTVAPATARRLAELHRAHGGSYIAAPVFGRPDAAKARRLWILAAGPAASRAAVRPLLDAMGQGVFDFGEAPASANVAKLIGNFLIAANLEAMSEAFAIAEKQGVDRAAVAEMLASTLFACPIYQGYGKAIAAKRFTPVGFRMPLGLKDVELALGMAREVTMALPMGSLVRDRLIATLAKGRGEMDWSAIALSVLDDAGLSHEPQRGGTSASRS